MTRPMTAHTPTPWSHNPQTSGHSEVFNERGLVGRIFTGDAALIVERVNGWDALLAERDEAVRLLKDVTECEKPCVLDCGCVWCNARAFLKVTR